MAGKEYALELCEFQEYFHPAPNRITYNIREVTESGLKKLITLVHFEHGAGEPVISLLGATDTEDTITICELARAKHAQLATLADYHSELERAHSIRKTLLEEHYASYGTKVPSEYSFDKWWLDDTGGML